MVFYFGGLAQTKQFTISGLISDAASGERLMNANIYEAKELIGTTSNIYGFYSLTLPQGSSGLYVRGGGPDQNLILLDGVPVYNVNHLFGFFSVFNADAIKNVSSYKGGFPA